MFNIETFVTAATALDVGDLIMMDQTPSQVEEVAYTPLFPDYVGIRYVPRMGLYAGQSLYAVLPKPYPIRVITLSVL